MKRLSPLEGSAVGPRVESKHLLVEETPCFQERKKRRWHAKPDRSWILQDCSLNLQTGCWEWERCIGRSGYGNVSVNGITEGAHRLAYFLWNGPIPHGRLVLHKCDNKKCCNPNHLFIGTHKENIRDAVAKNRMSRKYHGGKGKRLFTDREIREIRTVDISTNEWARMVGTCPTVIRFIRQIKTYKWVR